MQLPPGSESPPTIYFGENKCFQANNPIICAAVQLMPLDWMPSKHVGEHGAASMFRMFESASVTTSQRP